MSEPIRQFKGVWIPADVWLNPELSITEKVMLVEIDSLDSSDRGCYASNSHFAKFFNLSPSRISEIISGLADKGFCTVELIRDGKKVVERRVRMNKVFGKSNTYSESTANPIRKTEEGYSEKAEGSNTKINNTSKGEKGAAAGAPEAKPVKRSSSLPDGFALTDDDVEYAVSRFIDYATEFEGFVNFHKSKGTLMKDWRAAWRTWVGNAVKFGKARAPSKQAGPVFNPNDKSTWGFDARGKFSSSLYLQDEAKAYRVLNGVPDGQLDVFERDMGKAEIVQ
jgi:hypothetical protein